MDAMKEMDQLEARCARRFANAIAAHAAGIVVRVAWLLLAFAFFFGLFLGLELAHAGERDPVALASASVGNGNLYNRDGANWCADFIVEVFGDQLPVPPSRSARALWNAMRAASLETDDPQAGDLVFFRRTCANGEDWCGHVGIVVVRRGRHLGTVEGNVGGKVALRHYELGKIERLLGFGRTDERW